MEKKVAMPNLTISLSNELHRFIKDHPEIKWSQIVRNSLEKYKGHIKIMEKILEKTKTEEADIDELISKAMKRIYSKK